MKPDSRIVLPCLITLAFFPFLVGCGGEDAPIEESAPEVVAYDLVGRGHNARIQEVTEIRIRDQETWQAYADSLSPLGRLAEVDFDQRDVLLIAFPVTSGGYDLAVSTIQRQDDRLRVEYVIEEPGEDCLTAQVMLTPFVAVSIDKADVEPSFASQRERYSCSVRQR